LGRGALASAMGAIPVLSYPLSFVPPAAAKVPAGHAGNFTPLQGLTAPAHGPGGTGRKRGRAGFFSQQPANLMPRGLWKRGLGGRSSRCEE